MKEPRSSRSGRVSSIDARRSRGRGQGTPPGEAAARRSRTRGAVAGGRPARVFPAVPGNSGGGRMGVDPPLRESTGAFSAMDVRGEEEILAVSVPLTRREARWNEAALPLEVPVEGMGPVSLPLNGSALWRNGPALTLNRPVPQRCVRWDGPARAFPARTGLADRIIAAGVGRSCRGSGCVGGGPADR